MKGYLRLFAQPDRQPVEPSWFYDTDDPDETAAVSHIRARCLITDESGRTQEIGAGFPAEFRLPVRDVLNSPGRGKAFWIFESSRKVRYLVRAGTVVDEGRGGSRYFAALAEPLSRNGEALRIFDCTLAGLGIGALLLGWSLDRIVSQHADPGALRAPGRPGGLPH